MYQLPCPTSTSTSTSTFFPRLQRPGLLAPTLRSQDHQLLTASLRTPILHPRFTITWPSAESSIAAKLLPQEFPALDPALEPTDNLTIARVNRSITSFTLATIATIQASASPSAKETKHYTELLYRHITFPPRRHRRRVLLSHARNTVPLFQQSTYIVNNTSCTPYTKSIALEWGMRVTVPSR